MRYITINHVEPGVTVARDIFDMEYEKALQIIKGL